jgi:hypothetical protein
MVFTDVFPPDVVSDGVPDVPVLLLEDVAPDPVTVDVLVVVALLGVASTGVPLAVVVGVTPVPAPEFAVELGVAAEPPLVDAVELGSVAVSEVVEAGPCVATVADADAPLVLVPPEPVEVNVELGSPLAEVELAVPVFVVLDDGWPVAINWARSTTWCGAAGAAGSGWGAGVVWYTGAGGAWGAT